MSSCLAWFVGLPWHSAPFRGGAPTSPSRSNTSRWQTQTTQKWRAAAYFKIGENNSLWMLFASSEPVWHQSFKIHMTIFYLSKNSLDNTPNGSATPAVPFEEAVKRKPHPFFQHIYSLLFQGASIALIAPEIRSWQGCDSIVIVVISEVCPFLKKGQTKKTDVTCL